MPAKQIFWATGKDNEDPATRPFVTGQITDSTIDFFALLYSISFFFVCFYPYVNFSYLQKKKWLKWLIIAYVMKPSKTGIAEP